MLLDKIEIAEFPVCICICMNLTMHATQDLLRYAEKQAMLLDKIENAEFPDTHKERDVVPVASAPAVYNNPVYVNNEPAQQYIERRDVDAGSERGAETVKTRDERDVERENSGPESGNLPEIRAPPQDESSEVVPLPQERPAEVRSDEHEKELEEPHVDEIRPEGGSESESESAPESTPAGSPTEESGAAAAAGEEEEEGRKARGNSEEHRNENSEQHGDAEESEAHGKSEEHRDGNSEEHGDAGEAAEHGKSEEHGEHGDADESAAHGNSGEHEAEEEPAAAGEKGGKDEKGTKAHGDPNARGGASQPEASAAEKQEISGSRGAAAAQLHALAEKKRQTFDVRVPMGVKPGQVGVVRDALL